MGIKNQPDQSRRFVAPMKFLAVFVFGLLSLSTTTASAQDTLFIGVPKPPFGIDEQVPSLPVNWGSNETPGFYYVDQMNTLANDSRSYGSPEAPRRSIPTTLPAGSIVVLVGRYDADHTGGITIQGIASDPVFIIGSSSYGNGVFTKKWNVRGSYYILDGLEGDWQSGNGKLNIFGNHGVVRDGKFHGSRAAVGLGGVNVVGSYMVLLRNEVSDSGLLDTSVDADTHGTQIGANNDHVWILDSFYHHNSGDGVQINAGSEAAQSTTHHIYIAGNRFFANRQTGAWTKQAEHVIFSENESYGHVAQVGGAGAGLGTQYAAEHVWFIANKVYNNGGGIRIASDSGLGYGQHHYVVGNAIYANRNANSFDRSNPWANAGLSIWGGQTTYIINNTIWGNNGGIYSPRRSGELHSHGNIINSSEFGFELNLEFPQVIAASDYNIYDSGSSVQMGNASASALDGLRSLGHDENSLGVNNPGLLAPDTADFRLTPSSPAIDASNHNFVYEEFRRLYGIPIDKDLVGADRWSNGTIDIGATEYDQNTVIPDSPSDLN